MPVIVTLLPCKSVTMNLQCYPILFTVYRIIVALKWLPALQILVGCFTVQLLNITVQLENNCIATNGKIYTGYEISVGC